MTEHPAAPNLLLPATTTTDYDAVHAAVASSILCENFLYWYQDPVTSTESGPLDWSSI